MSRGRSDGRASGIGQGSRRVSQNSATGSLSSGAAGAAAAAAAASAASSPGGGRPSRLLADDASADVIAMARELGVGVSPVGPPGGGGLRSRLFDGHDFDQDRSSAQAGSGRASGVGGIGGGDRLSPVPAMSAAEADAEGGTTAHLSVDTDNIEALLGSLGQGAVV